MKKSDLAMIILVAAISIGIAMFVVDALPFLKAPEEAVKIDSIKRYESTISDPDKDVFNASAINPTVDINIGDSATPSEE